MLGKDSVKKTLLVSILLCLVCSVLVSGSAVLLKPIQQMNKELDMKTNILAAGGLLEVGISVDELFKKVRPVVVDLLTGEIVTDIDVNKFDQYVSQKDPRFTYVIPRSSDLAGIKIRSKYSKVYLVLDDYGISEIILPVHGKGLWSTMYGFMALDKDTTTVKGFSFYSHGETPGLGGEVDNSSWKKLWQGKKLYDDNWVSSLNVIKGVVDKSNEKAVYQVDGLSGATLTSNGVSNIISYWSSHDGFAKFLEKVRSGGVQL